MIGFQIAIIAATVAASDHTLAQAHARSQAAVSLAYAAIATQSDAVIREEPKSEPDHIADTGKKVEAVYFFTGPNCPACERAKPAVLQLWREGYPLFTVDEAAHPKMHAKYRIEGIPTFVFLRGGNEVGRQVGALPIGQLRAKIEGHDIQSASGPARKPANEPGRVRPITHAANESRRTVWARRSSVSVCGPDGCF